ncbi:MAG: HEAT repeat domain-containing protein [Planctomycetes bacterium]|nr:HEAT repeat domain-containing protein [Planctomycetota bacterium]
MNPELEKICALLASGSAELQCAAAMVLGELRPRDAAARKALARALQSANDTVRTYAVEALAKIGATEAVPHLIPLLGAAPALKARAMKVIAEAGGEVVDALRERLKDADPEVRKGIVEALGRLGGDSLELLVRALKDKDPAVPAQAAASFEAQVGRMAPAQRKSAARQVVEVLKRGAAPGAALQILGALGDPSALPALLSFAGPKQAADVRVAALRAVARVGADAKKTLARLLPVFDEPGDVAKAAAEVLERLRIAKADLPKVLRFMDHAVPAVRVAAIRALGALGTPEAAGALAKALGSGDREVSDAAAGSLRSNAAFVPALLKALASEADLARAWKIADVVRSVPGALAARGRKALTAQCLSLLEKRDERYRLFFEILRTLCLDDLRAALLRHGRDRMRRKKFEEAEAFLRLLEPDDLATPEALTSLAVTRLKQRKSDSAMALLAKVLHASDFALVEALDADRALLGAADLLHVGFRFIERQGAEREFGAGVMKLIVRRCGSSREAQVAKQKLKTQGIG